MLKIIGIGVVMLHCGTVMAAEKEGSSSFFIKNSSVNGKAHPCADDAIAKALPLLQLHFCGGNGCKSDAKDSVGRENIESSVKTIGSMKVPVGKGRMDILEVTGHVYKANYRMRFLYAQIPNTCALMGQEILEIGNPY